MPAALDCPTCRRPLRLPEEALGQLVQCPLCFDDFIADPAAAKVVAAAPAPAPPPAQAAPAVVETAPVTLVDEAETAPAEALVPEPAAVVTVSPVDFRPLFFPVLVRDPDRVLKGLWDAELTETGLRLTRPRHSAEFIPVGKGSARHLRANRLAVNVHGREVVLELDKPRVDQARLARDVAAYLNGERGPLDPGGYRVPKWLWLLPLAPLGLPIVGIARDLLLDGVGGVFLWLLIWAVTAVVALILTRRSTWTVRQRLTGGSVTAGAGYLFLLLMALFGPSGPRRIPSNEWAYVPTGGGGWQALMPVSRTVSAMPRADLFGLQGDFYSVYRPREDLTFVAGPVANVGGGDDFEVFKQARSRLQTWIVGPPTGDVSIRHPSGAPGRELVFRKVRSVSVEGALVLRFYLIGGRLYVLAVHGPKASPDHPDVKKFLDSLHVGGLAAGPDPGGLLYAASFEGRDQGQFLFGAVAVEGGVRGKALRCVGGDSHFDFSNAANLNFDQGVAFTVAVWFKTRRQDATLVSLRNVLDERPKIELRLNGGALLALAQGTPRRAAEDRLVRLPGRPVNDDRWHHAALTRDAGGTYLLYIDGVEEARCAGHVAGGAVPIQTNLRALGRDPVLRRNGDQSDATTYLGLIAEFAVYNRDLTADEVRRLATPPP
jgi:hypothetical protein